MRTIMLGKTKLSAQNCVVNCGTCMAFWCSPAMLLMVSLSSSASTWCFCKQQKIQNAKHRTLVIRHTRLHQTSLPQQLLSHCRILLCVTTVLS